MITMIKLKKRFFFFNCFVNLTPKDMSYYLNKKNIKLIIATIIFVVFVFPFRSKAQSGITFGEFAKRLETYFDKEMIQDIAKSLQDVDKSTIWGWDVGDYSGDGNLDVAFTYRINGEKKNVVYLDLFVDIDGYFVKVGEFPYQFIDLPLEVGASIKNGVCYVTQKIANANWKMDGYQLVDGSLILRNDYSSEKLDFYTIDKKNDYYNLKNSEKIYENTKGMEKYSRSYYVIPCYNRGRLIYHGFSDVVKVDDIDFVTKGAYYWDGPKDANFEVSSAYDQEYVYFQIKVYDDNVVVKKCDSCAGDYVSLWFDALNVGDTLQRYQIKDKNLTILNQLSKSVYNFQIFPGDFVDIPAYVNTFSNDILTSLQQVSASHIKVAANKIDSGYVVKIKIPYEILDIDPMNFTNSFYRISCTIQVHDVDNGFRPEEETVLSTSQFDITNASTFGTLLFVPNNDWYGRSTNIYKQDIYQTLLEFGY